MADTSDNPTIPTSMVDSNPTSTQDQPTTTTTTMDPIDTTIIPATQDSSLSPSTLLDLYLLTPTELISHPTLTDTQKRNKITELFIRSCSNGDIGKVRELLGVDGNEEKGFRKWIDIDGKDEDGTSGLIYASCWGHSDVVEILLEAGAKVDERDKHGWTGLLWACSNGHDETARLLIESGASKDAKSNRGRSIKDLVKRTDASKTMAKILEYEVGSSLGGNVNRNSVEYLGSGSSSSYDSEVDEVESVVSKFSVLSSESKLTRLSVDELGLFEEDESDSIPFDWDKCQLDQMFVFDEKKLNHILDVAVCHLRPTKGAYQKPVAANIIFLCARYAHYWNSAELLHELFAKAVKKIIAEIQV
ncbi:hypothetical protein HDU76_002728 [Blyttiomyces sp. JEL0837]|nr:hypothetical protein HDU76_002728 [Blyttiomyces sp. JEL0837]